VGAGHRTAAKLVGRAMKIGAVGLTYSAAS